MRALLDRFKEKEFVQGILSEIFAGYIMITVGIDIGLFFKSFFV